ncbi:LamB/YcsF family protein (plasmid) [Methylobacterium sp. NMS14P]|uniref:LamB/YcsF family protein n=1 Tax=Methylobacterium sp. NMS14P TaxID=2894310 RepID=UPI00235A109E|nr:5-oxoprolinase subunit PxpA [Methylobacterium sp. NMS14P]WCS28788.1 LamB/YcsF family protein [Methylobacterium sp. NMS14P]
MIVDLNCDMGEGFGVYRLGDDAEMLTVATSANIACGFHAGDPLVMHETLSRAAANGVQAGAHPSFLDLWGFGRRPIHGERPADIEKAVLYQVGALLALAQDAGCPVRHVKTHGAMGNMANEDADLALAVARAVRTLDRDLIFVVMPGLETERAGEKLGLPIAREIYADRAYADDGTLVSRKLPGAVLHDPDAVSERVARMLEDGAITCLSGRRIPTRIDTVCVHGDTPGAVAMARRLRDDCAAKGIVLRPMAEVLGV